MAVNSKERCCHSDLHSSPFFSPSRIPRSDLTISGLCTAEFPFGMGLTTYPQSGTPAHAAGWGGSPLRFKGLHMWKACCLQSSKFWSLHTARISISPKRLETKDVLGPPGMVFMPKPEHCLDLQFGYVADHNGKTLLQLWNEARLKLC